MVIKHRGTTVIAAVADERLQWYLTQEWNSHFTRKARSAAGSEKIMPLVTSIAHKVAHVLDNAQHRHVQFAEQTDSFACIILRHLLRRHNYHRAVRPRVLNQRKRNVPRARRQVDDQRILFAPLDTVQELANQFVGHRATPDERLLGVYHKADRNNPYAMRFRRNDFAVAGRR
jgi:hypothetical protein